MQAYCHKCKATIDRPFSEQVFPDVLDPSGRNGFDARAALYQCQCGHRLSKIAYEPTQSAPPSAP